jgi:hypothetical protein
MNVIVPVLAVILITSAVIFLEGIWRGRWTRKYYSFGMKIYERTIPGNQKTLVDIYAEMNKRREKEESHVITYRLTDENDGIFFRNTYSHLLYRSFSLVHGVIKCENDSIKIIGYLGLTEVFYVCVIPYLLCYYYSAGGNAIVLPVALLVWLGNLVYSASVYVQTKNRLDDI